MKLRLCQTLTDCKSGHAPSQPGFKKQVAFQKLSN